MAIKFDKQTFQLHTKNTTYQLQIDTHGRLMHLHYGKKIEDTDLSYMTKGLIAPTISIRMKWRLRVIIF